MGVGKIQKLINLSGYVIKRVLSHPHLNTQTTLRVQLITLANRYFHVFSGDFKFQFCNLGRQWPLAYIHTLHPSTVVLNLFGATAPFKVSTLVDHLHLQSNQFLKYGKTFFHGINSLVKVKLIWKFTIIRANVMPELGVLPTIVWSSASYQSLKS